LWQKPKITIFINTDDRRIEKNRRLTGGFFSAIGFLPPFCFALLMHYLKNKSPLTHARYFLNEQKTFLGYPEFFFVWLWATIPPVPSANCLFFSKGIAPFVAPTAHLSRQLWQSSHIVSFYPALPTISMELF
jgi:hypothetical protein